MVVRKAMRMVTCATNSMVHMSRTLVHSQLLTLIVAVVPCVFFVRWRWTQVPPTSDAVVMPAPGDCLMVTCHLFGSRNPRVTRPTNDPTPIQSSLRDCLLSHN
jgi:hypothetical protein